jgi:NADH-ubiquinone oxidoreductase chain 5
MFLLIFSANLVTILVGWDLLGFTSFFLVSFYGNRRRHAAALITGLRNRVGDCFYFLVLGLTLSSSHFAVITSVTLLILVGMTKSAQLPFSSWLPSAIYAPTPVSALVHSSTLVTAGIFLLMRFSCSLDVLKLSIGVLTTIFAGIAACLESDSKKIIALSTLSQLGIIITGLGLGLRSLTFNHMLTHAIVKALLFVCIGIIIHTSFGSQEVRFPLLLCSGSTVILIRFVIGIISLGGLAFTSCFFTKDALLESGYCIRWGLFALFFFYISLGLTVAYLLRVLLHFFSSKYSVPLLMPGVQHSFFLVMPVLILLSSL